MKGEKIKEKISSPELHGRDTWHGEDIGQQHSQHTNYLAKSICLCVSIKKKKKNPFKVKADFYIEGLPNPSGNVLMGFTANYLII